MQQVDGSWPETGTTSIESALVGVTHGRMSRDFCHLIDIGSVGPNPATLTSEDRDAFRRHYVLALLASALPTCLGTGVGNE